MVGLGRCMRGGNTLDPSFCSTFPPHNIFLHNASLLRAKSAKTFGLGIKRQQHHYIGAARDKYIDQVLDKIRRRAVQKVRVRSQVIGTAEAFGTAKDTRRQARHKYGRDKDVHSISRSTSQVDVGAGAVDSPSTSGAGRQGTVEDDS